MVEGSGTEGEEVEKTESNLAGGDNKVSIKALVFLDWPDKNASRTSHSLLAVRGLAR